MLDSRGSWVLNHLWGLQDAVKSLSLKSESRRTTQGGGRRPVDATTRRNCWVQEATVAVQSSLTAVIGERLGCWYRLLGHGNLRYHLLTKCPAWIRTRMNWFGEYLLSLSLIKSAGSILGFRKEAELP